jgi:hypothetical protein
MLDKGALVPFMVRMPGGEIKQVFYKSDTADKGVVYVIDDCKPVLPSEQGRDTELPSIYLALDLDALVGTMPVPIQALMRLAAWLCKASLSPGWLTRAAVFIAGGKHSASRCEWQAHLAGEPGLELSRRDQVRAARGFVWAAVRYRVEDAAELAWQPVDAVLRSRFLSGIFIAGPVLAVVLAILHHDGRYGLALDVQDPFCVGACTWGTILGLRKWRKVRPPERQPRQSRE